MLTQPIKKLIRTVLLIRNSPHSLALGVALGLFIGLTPTVGIQMLLVVVIGTLIGANRIIALVLCWISNPLTFLPLYYLFYLLGAWILGTDLWTFVSFSRKMNDMIFVRDESGFMGVFRLFSYEVFGPMWLGSVIIALVVAVPSYPLTRRLVVRFRVQRSVRRKMRQSLNNCSRPDEDLCDVKKHPGESPSPPDAAATGKSKSLVLLLLGISLFMNTCSRGEQEVPEHHPDTGSPAYVDVAILELSSGCIVCVELTPGAASSLREPLQRSVGDELYHAYLRIYNFADTPGDLMDVATYLAIESAEGSSPLGPLGSFGDQPPSKTLELLRRAYPKDALPAQSWTRVLMGYRASAAKERSPALNCTIPGRERRLPFRRLPRGEWTAFIDHPSRAALQALDIGSAPAKLE